MANYYYFHWIIYGFCRNSTFDIEFHVKICISAVDIFIYLKKESFDKILGLLYSASMLW